jgi:hypothetical protein
LALASTPGHALSFEYSFTGSPLLGNLLGTVTGQIDGLQDNTPAFMNPATAIFIDSAPRSSIYPRHFQSRLPVQQTMVSPSAMVKSQASRLASTSITILP